MTEFNFTSVQPLYSSIRMPDDSIRISEKSLSMALAVGNRFNPVKLGSADRIQVGISVDLANNAIRLDANVSDNSSYNFYHSFALKGNASYINSSRVLRRSINLPVGMYREVAPNVFQLQSTTGVAGDTLRQQVQA